MCIYKRAKQVESLRAEGLLKLSLPNWQLWQLATSYVCVRVCVSAAEWAGVWVRCIASFDIDDTQRGTSEQ